MANENPFASSKQSLILKPKTVAIQALHYKGFEDLKTLIDFVGSTPKIDVDKTGNPVLSFRKQTVRDNTIILRNSFGEVTRVMSYAEAAEVYEISAQSEFKAEHKNKVVDKPVKKREVKK